MVDIRRAAKACAPRRCLAESAAPSRPKLCQTGERHTKIILNTSRVEKEGLLHLLPWIGEARRQIFKKIWMPGKVHICRNNEITGRLQDRGHRVVEHQIQSSGLNQHHSPSKARWGDRARLSLAWEAEEEAVFQLLRWV